MWVPESVRIEAIQGGFEGFSGSVGYSYLRASMGLSRAARQAG